MSSFFASRPLAAASPTSSRPILFSIPLYRVSRPCVSFPLHRTSRRWRLKVPRAENVANGAESKPPNGNLPKSRRDILLEYVKNVQPEFMDLFIKRAPPQIVDAMRQTVTNMIGTLPPQFFAVTVTTVAENLAQLMYSVLMTGYMFRNAQYRLELQQSLEQAALLDTKEVKDETVYAPGTQKKVIGEVIRWNKTSGPETMDAVKYIELLEAEIEELKSQVIRKTANGQNDLLDYLKTLEPQNLKELTSSAGEDVVFAMNSFIKRLLAVSDPAQLKTTPTETSAPELAKLLYWLMVVGYSIRNIEVRFDMERVLGTPPKLAELPPGEDI
ncbi:GrpE nucleotide exchange factor coiled-coil-containing protein [Dioscorea alata]|uniref:GrpE nucleotide exchange factor coiled-coil-containing protein n=1 Tax=Dioscorea alata TaxID=55571 RepID=A0ACB7V6H0_DIOAL|nr:GrpE nucleotide exchange factor coiled-coil-containing protein [Dioscorea alata]